MFWRSKIKGLIEIWGDTNIEISLRLRIEVVCLRDTLALCLIKY